MTLSNIRTTSRTFNLEPTNIKRWTVKIYHRMSELDILDPNERTELIAGQIAGQITIYKINRLKICSGVSSSRNPLGTGNNSLLRN